MFICPVCGYPELRHPPKNYEICPSCGVEFEYWDCCTDHGVLRKQWFESGAKWWSSCDVQPEGWDPLVQLQAAGLTIPFEC